MSEYSPNYSITPNILKLIESISRKQGELNSHTHPIQNELELFSQANIDAVHFSTKLEGNSLSAKQVTQILGGSKKNIRYQKDIKEIINYSKARTLLFDLATSRAPLTEELILKIHKILLTNILEGNLKGKLRKEQNMIKDSRSHQIIYLPPEPQDVSILLRELLQWIHTAEKNKVSPLITAPIFHYRFVTIHPFIDGNGRCARLLTNYLLQKNNLSVSRLASIEKRHEQNKSRYYQELRKLQSNQFYDISSQISISSWIEYWLEMLDQTYDEALQRVTQLAATPAHLHHLEDRLQKAYSFFMKHKRMSASEYGLLMGIKRTQAVNDLNKLCKHKLIKKTGGGRSLSYYVNSERIPKD